MGQIVTKFTDGSFLESAHGDSPPVHIVLFKRRIVLRQSFCLAVKHFDGFNLKAHKATLRHYVF